MNNLGNFATFAALIALYPNGTALPVNSFAWCSDIGRVAYNGKRWNGAGYHAGFTYRTPWSDGSAWCGFRSA